MYVVCIRMINPVSSFTLTTANCPVIWFHSSASRHTKNILIFASFISTLCLFQSLVVYLLRTLSGGDPMSTWGRSSQLCSASLRLKPLATGLTGHSSTTVEWNSNWLVRTPKTQVTVKTLMTSSSYQRYPCVGFYPNRQLSDKFKWGQGARNHCGICME